ncbi:hypothetical protein [Streptomyces sp. CBMA156]|uniref:hypothetical protein n=1 Tax=Streptomyces sp. CBMA156 TaxID=1930280 RepID=UPI001661B1F5|nr:hypothetical protein [Streptomyces sp. CBMA156]MBD0676301.1 hypothetical protein [Streptomyces sp. CBMA156]MBD0676772.1 hypothetical protein [Streptomyces sp. CBMA156]
MAALRKKSLTAAVATGAAVLLGAALAQPAAAVEFPHASVAYFAAGANLTGARTVVDTADTGCHNIPAAASAVNYTAADIRVYYTADCRTGLPGKPSDLAFGLGSLSWANFTYPALSYQVVR